MIYNALATGHIFTSSVVLYLSQSEMHRVLLTFTLLLACAAATNYVVFPVCEPGSNYYMQHPRYCDRYLTCVDGFIHEGQCKDGMAFQPDEYCVYSHLVDCTSRPYFQPPQPMGVCPHLYGLFPDPERGCNHFYECAEGAATPNSCVKGLMFDAEKRECRQPTKEEYMSCFAEEIIVPDVVAPDEAMTPEPQVMMPMDTTTTEPFTTTESLMVEGFKCPANVIYPYGDHARYPYPGKCRFFLMCWKNGNVTVGGCERGLAFDARTFTCEPFATVPGCRSTAEKL